MYKFILQIYLVFFIRIRLQYSDKNSKIKFTCQFRSVITVQSCWGGGGISQTLYGMDLCLTWGMYTNFTSIFNTGNSTPISYHYSAGPMMKIVLGSKPPLVPINSTQWIDQILNVKLLFLSSSPGSDPPTHQVGFSSKIKQVYL